MSLMRGIIGADLAIPYIFPYLNMIEESPGMCLITSLAKRAAAPPPRGTVSCWAAETANQIAKRTSLKRGTNDFSLR